MDVLDRQERIAAAVAGLNQLLGPDGARLELRVEWAGAAVLDLRLQDASCADCIVPPPLLKELIEAAFVREQAGPVEVVDPRA